MIYISLKKNGAIINLTKTKCQGNNEFINTSWHTKYISLKKYEQINLTRTKYQRYNEAVNMSRHTLV